MPMGVDQLASVLFGVGVEAHVSLHHLARAVLDHAEGPVVGSAHTGCTVHLAEQGRKPVAAVLDARHDQVREAAEQVVQHERREGVTHGPIGESGDALERAQPVARGVGLLAPLRRVQLGETAVAQVERHRQTSFLASRPERVEVRVGR